MVALKKILLEKDHPGIQFLKYSMCGGMALATDMITFFLIAWLVFPALTEGDFLVRIFHLQVEPVPEGIRTLNFILGNAIAFVVSNMTAYILNILFVFKSGKHNRWKELGLFYLVSGISVGLGVLIGAVLIEWFGLSTTSSYVAKAISTTLINYAARKFFIFNG
ncbi:GtrA family protein [Pontiellaceae bacterium B1224]|nr:GtrA family protein [Pontiellaceae bacterium B1224]